MTTKRILLATTLSAALLGGAIAVAQGDSSEIEIGKHWLALMNHKGDTDNTISRAEFNHYMDDQFKAADTDHDGTLDAAELGHLHTMLLGK
jgi:hypothetical protein